MPPMGEVSQPVFTSFSLEADDSVDEIHSQLMEEEKDAAIFGVFLLTRIELEL